MLPPTPELTLPARRRSQLDVIVGSVVVGQLKDYDVFGETSLLEGDLVRATLADDIGRPRRVTARICRAHCVDRASHLCRCGRHVDITHDDCGL